MKQPFSEEILSAYIDDELPAQERAAVERWLEESPEAREKLDGFRRLSGLFADLPRNEVPPEFPTNVLQLAERRMLLPEARPVQPRQSLRRWALAGGSSIAAALALGLTLHAYLPDGGPNQKAVRFDAHGERPARRPGNRRSLPSGGSMKAKCKSRRPTIASNQVLVLARGPLSTHEPGAGPAAPASADDILDRDSPESVVGRSAGAIARRERSKSAESAAALASISPAQQEQIDKAMDEIGKTPEDEDVVAVVKFHVIDRAEGLVLLQDAFADSQILVESEQLSKEGRSEGKIGAKSAAPAAVGNEALYVVAEPEQLRAAIATILAREKFALGLEIGESRSKSPPSTTSPKKRVQQVDRELISDVVGNKPASPDDAKKSADAPPAAERKEPAQPKSDEKPGLETAAPALAEKKSLSKVQAGAREPQKPSEPKQKDDASRAAELKSPVPQDKELIEAPASQARQTVVNLPVESANQRSRTGAQKRMGFPEIGKPEFSRCARLQEGTGAARQRRRQQRRTRPRTHAGADRRRRIGEVASSPGEPPGGHRTKGWSRPISAVTATAAGICSDALSKIPSGQRQIVELNAVRAQRDPVAINPAAR